MFKPHKFYWVLLILTRKAAIAFTSLMFKKNPSFQLAMALFIMFTSYALQVMNRPYMSMVERPEVIRLAAERGELPSTNPSVAMAQKIREQRMRKKGKRSILRAMSGDDSSESTAHWSRFVTLEAKINK